MAPPRENRPDVQAILDSVRAGGAFGDVDDAPQPAPSADHAVSDLLQRVQTHFAETLRGRDSLAHALREMESQLAKLNAELAGLRAEREHLTRLKSLYERKFAGIRELAQREA